MHVIVGHIYVNVLIFTKVDLYDYTFNIAMLSMHDCFRSKCAWVSNGVCI